MDLTPYELTEGAQLVRSDASNLPQSCSFTIHAAAGDDLFFEPEGEKRVSQGTFWVGMEADGSFQFSLRASVPYRSQFDSLALVVYVDEDHWAKVCLEQDTQGRARFVSVVTNGKSDDSNGPFFHEEAVFLRASRKGNVVAFHGSIDGTSWDLVRLFSFSEDGTAPVKVGLMAQSPCGSGLEVTVLELMTSFEALNDPRSSF